MDLKRLLSTWCALMLLLGATIGASFLPIGVWRQVINLNIAGAKAVLILGIFMKLRSEATLVRLAFAASGALLLVLATMLTADYHLRPQTLVSPVSSDSRAEHLPVVSTGTARFPARSGAPRRQRISRDPRSGERGAMIGRDERATTWVHPRSKTIQPIAQTQSRLAPL